MASFDVHKVLEDLRARFAGVVGLGDGYAAFTRRRALRRWGIATAVIVGFVVAGVAGYALGVGAGGRRRQRSAGRDGRGSATGHGRRHPRGLCEHVQARSRAGLRQGLRRCLRHGLPRRVREGGPRGAPARAVERAVNLSTASDAIREAGQRWRWRWQPDRRIGLRDLRLLLRPRNRHHHISDRQVRRDRRAAKQRDRAAGVPDFVRPGPRGRGGARQGGRGARGTARRPACRRAGRRSHRRAPGLGCGRALPRRRSPSSRPPRLPWPPLPRAVEPVRRRQRLRPFPRPRQPGHRHPRPRPLDATVPRSSTSRMSRLAPAENRVAAQATRPRSSRARLAPVRGRVAGPDPTLELRLAPARRRRVRRSVEHRACSDSGTCTTPHRADSPGLPAVHAGKCRWPRSRRTRLR